MININPKFEIGEQILIPEGTKTNGLWIVKDCIDEIEDIQISITKKGTSIRYHLKQHCFNIFKESMLRKLN